MFGLEKFVESFKDPRIVIPTLIAVIITGGLGGTLWISNLRETIANSKEMEAKKASLLTTEGEINISRLTRRFVDFEYEFKKFKQTVNRTKDSIDQSLIKIERILINDKNSKASDSAISELNLVRTGIISFNNEVTNLDSQLQFSRSSFMIALTSAKTPRSEKQTYIAIAVTIILFLILAFTIGYFYNKRKRNKYGIQNDTNERNESNS